MALITDLFIAGWKSLEYYVLQHTLTCLLPAFFLAGAMVTFMNREAILDLLGEQANIFKAFTLAAAASFLVAACSCTVIPVAAGLYYAGAGVGVAFIILWVAPAANVLALVYTGTILGAEMVTMRVVAALLVAFAVGMVMRYTFRHEHRAQETASNSPEDENESEKVGEKKDDAASRSQNAAEPGESTAGPGGSAAGMGTSTEGRGTSAAGLGASTEGRGTSAAGSDSGPPRPPIISRTHFGLIVLVLISLLAPNYLVQEGPYLHKVLVWGGATLAAALYAWRMIPWSQITRWVGETWWFIRVIFPLLLAGVFLVGVIQAILPEQWVQDWLGSNTMLASFLATLIGAVSYFATMTEAPFVDALMDMGMGYGPALTLLLVGPGISLPNWLAIARVFGIKKAMVYVPTIIILGTIVGWFFGNFIL